MFLSLEGHSVVNWLLQWIIIECIYPEYDKMYPLSLAVLIIDINMVKTRGLDHESLFLSYWHSRRNRSSCDFFLNHNSHTRSHFCWDYIESAITESYKEVEIEKQEKRRIQKYKLRFTSRRRNDRVYEQFLLLTLMLILIFFLFVLNLNYSVDDWISCSLTTLAIGIPNGIPYFFLFLVYNDDVSHES